ncbi:MAG: hypothetical protein JO257_18935 [Deltaproteobacteria bacterium]|nr:hypothetical protein [Deltaproteobacteria bacterium]
MKVLAIALACASCVSSSPDSGQPAGDFGEIPVVGAPAEPSSTARSGIESHAPGRMPKTPIVRTYDDDDHGTDACHAVAVADDGSFVVAGEVQRLAEGRNAWARRYAPNGDVAWTYELHTPSEGADAARGVVALDGGAAVLAGQWYSGSPSAVNNFVAQVGSNGSAQWLQEGELAGTDQFASVARTGTGGLVVAGARDSQAWVHGLDASGGATGWDVLDGSDASARKVAVAASGDVLVGGNSGGQGWVTRYRGQQVAGTVSIDGAVTDIAPAGDGVAIISNDALAVYDANGMLAWETPAEADASWRAVAARPDGSLVVAGVLGDRLAVRVYAANGHKRSQRTVAGAVPEAIAANGAGDIVVCGSRSGDVYVVKFPR